MLKIDLQIMTSSGKKKIIKINCQDGTNRKKIRFPSLFHGVLITRLYYLNAGELIEINKKSNILLN